MAQLKNRVLLLGPGSVIHMQRWANALALAGYQVVCASQHEFLEGGWHSSVKLVKLPYPGSVGYFLNTCAVRRLHRECHGTLTNAHYATGYGTLATLAGVRPRLISVWGSDVYDFPAKSRMHREQVRWVLQPAQGVASTSEVMAAQVRRVMPSGWGGKVDVTPFGVDLNRFTPAAAACSPGGARPLVIGTVKTLAHKYGIDTLIRAYALLAADRSLIGTLPQGLRLRLVGGGEQRVELEALVGSLGLQEQVEFVGATRHADVPHWLQGFDIYAAASRLDSESFGVAIIEASACGLPVVVTRVGGLPEVVLDGQTGLVVERESPQALAAALKQLALDSALRRRLGERGRAHVAAKYDWPACVDRMAQVYRRVSGWQ